MHLLVPKLFYEVNELSDLHKLDALQIGGGEQPSAFLRLKGRKHLSSSCRPIAIRVNHSEQVPHCLLVLIVLQCLRSHVVAGQLLSFHLRGVLTQHTDQNVQQAKTGQEDEQQEHEYQERLGSLHNRPGDGIPRITRHDLEQRECGPRDRAKKPPTIVEGVAGLGAIHLAALNKKLLVHLISVSDRHGEQNSHGVGQNIKQQRGPHQGLQRAPEPVHDEVQLTKHPDQPHQTQQLEESKHPQQ
mmetsp:Transcript_89537/g.240071  ORF Transcript_89537/g.240071 Transcript_89537/m.240071 type:complete len:243 (-) Transcript_89537:15-743(-)